MKMGELILNSVQKSGGSRVRVREGEGKLRQKTRNTPLGGDRTHKGYCRHNLPTSVVDDSLFSHVRCLIFSQRHISRFNSGGDKWDGEYGRNANRHIMSRYNLQTSIDRTRNSVSTVELTRHHNAHETHGTHNNRRTTQRIRSALQA